MTTTQGGAAARGVTSGVSPSIMSQILQSGRAPAPGTQVKMATPGQAGGQQPGGIVVTQLPQSQTGKGQFCVICEFYLAI